MSRPADVVTGETLRGWLTRAAAMCREQRAYLTQLDAAIGDADHGMNMDRGFAAVEGGLAALAADAGAGMVLATAGETLVGSVGGASGTLWGTAFRSAGAALGDASEVDGLDLAAALDAALDAIVELGVAQEGDKTMVDALAPACRALRLALDAGKSLPGALEDARLAAEEGMRATIPLQARKGRASYLGERSIGHQDPGATSSMLVVAALALVVGAPG